MTPMSTLRVRITAYTLYTVSGRNTRALSVDPMTRPVTSSPPGELAVWVLSIYDAAEWSVDLLNTLRFPKWLSTAPSGILLLPNFEGWSIWVLAFLNDLPRLHFFPVHCHHKVLIRSCSRLNHQNHVENLCILRLKWEDIQYILSPSSVSAGMYF